MMDYKQLTSSYAENAIATLADWIKINSVLDKSTVDVSKPFGEGVNFALRYIGRIAERDGFAVDYCNGYATEISFGEGTKTIGIYAHADVVPATGNWKHDPFGAEIENNKMYGRGTSDDKGPAVAAYYAFKALRDHDLIKGFRVTLVIGGNEENGSACMHHYFQVLKKPAPTYGFTPDAAFPLIYGEKGISNYITSGEVDLRPILSIQAGAAANSVIDLAIATLIKDETVEQAFSKSKFKYEIKHTEKETTVKVFGQSAHGSTPEEGKNAGIELIRVLGKHYNLEVLNTLAKLYSKTDGSSLGHFYQSELLHATTYNVGIITYQKKMFKFIVNFRYPETVDSEAVITSIAEKSPLFTDKLSDSPFLLFDPKSKFVQKLLEVYQQETGDMVSQPMAIGGGTYAKECPNTIAFGSAFVGSDDQIHSPDEHINLSDLIASMAIYAHAIVTLGTEL